MTSRPNLQTLCAHAGTPAREESAGRNAPFVTPIVQTSLFDLGDSEEAEALFSGARAGYTYTRFANPTVDGLAAVIAELEGGAGALITASGNAAAVCSLTACLRGENDRILTHPSVFGATLEVLRIFAERYRVAVDMVDPRHTEEWRTAVARASVVFVETPSNPLMGLVDLEDTVQQAHRAGAQVIVDNTVATPCNQEPFRFGVDWIVHATSKYLNGHSDMIGGCLISRRPLEARHRSIHRALGGTVNALDAWLVLRGVRTLTLRMDMHNRNGAAVAEWLDRHPSVHTVYYPGLHSHPQAALFQRQMKAGGAVLSFELKGGELSARRFIDRLKLIGHALSFGGPETLAVRPSVTSHRALTPEMRLAAGVTDSLVRLSVGTEALEDILADLQQALA
jgi:methionine-gamma-lyase